MSTRFDPDLHRPLIDPAALEEAGRNFRLWLERLLRREPREADTSIDWETGEPDDKAGPPRY